MNSWLAAAAAALWFAQAGAPVQQEDDVVVEGTRLREAIQSFVGALSVEAGSEDQLARWSNRVCPGVVGLRREQAQAIADRIAIRALGVGLEVGEPGCRPNVLVLVTSVSDALAQEIVSRHGALVARFSDPGVNTRGREALADFANTPRTVRWWHISRTATADGTQSNPVSSGSVGGDMTLAQGGATRTPNASRINRATRQDLARAIIVVDGPRAGGVSVGVLGDYVAMAALAQLDPDADTSQFPTVLNLFADRATEGGAPTGLTNWDLAYLEGLYGAHQARSAGAQQREIGNRLARDLGATD